MRMRITRSISVVLSSGWESLKLFVSFSITDNENPTILYPIKDENHSSYCYLHPLKLRIIQASIIVAQAKTHSYDWTLLSMESTSSFILRIRISPGQILFLIENQSQSVRWWGQLHLLLLKKNNRQVNRSKSPGKKTINNKQPECQIN